MSTNAQVQQRVPRSLFGFSQSDGGHCAYDLRQQLLEGRSALLDDWLRSQGEVTGSRFMPLAACGCMPELKNCHRWRPCRQALATGVLYPQSDLRLTSHRDHVYPRHLQQGALLCPDAPQSMQELYRKQLHVVSRHRPGGVPYRPRKFTRLPAYLRRASIA